MMLLQISEQTSEGYVILVTGLLIVFTALVMLSVFFKYGLPLVLYLTKVIRKGRGKKVSEISISTNEDFTGEVSAVIGAAVHLYLNEQHDHEHAILTIKQVKKPYSPWSSKIYGAYNRLLKK